MFVKYPLQDISNGFGNINAIMSDLKGVVDGTITSASGFSNTVCDVDNALFYGSVNTSIYSTSYTAATSDTDDTELTISKKHHSANSTYDFTRDHKIWWTATGTYGLRTGFQTPTSYIPEEFDNGSHYLGSDVSSDLYSGNLTNAHTILLHISDYYFMMSIHYGTQGFTSGILDYKITNTDYYAMDNLSGSLQAGDYYPGANWMYRTHSWNSTEESNTADASLFTLQNYVSVNQSIELYTDNQEHIYMQYDNGSADNDQAIIPSPSPWRNVTAMPINGGEEHPLIPVSWQTWNSNSNAPAVKSYFPHFYRTTNDIGYPGQIITFDGVDYVVMYGGHKAGGYARTDIDDTHNGCYLVPKLIGGN